VGATIRSSVGIVIPAFASATLNTWLKIVDLPSFTPRGSYVLLTALFSGFIAAYPTGGDLWLGIYKNGTLAAKIIIPKSTAST
jgi:hypothetical protein